MTREEERKEVAKNRANQYSHPVEWYDCYKHWIEGAEWADSTMIERACEWLKNNKDNPFIKCEDPCLSGYLTDEFIDEFRKAMKE